ncbi:MAG: divergent polysaccharide deacetylase family protein [Deltaproteobacteria bacterium]|nr:divergent polysaccharide deacetylase family protein [Deltaproteobacteria bacterium]
MTSSKKRRGFPFLAVVIAAALIAAAVLFLERWEIRPPEGPAAPESRDKGIAARPSAEGKRAQEKRQEQRIAVLIDDIGFDLPLVKELAALPAPIAFAVLPQTPHAAEAAAILHAAGKEILLHLPMEPRAYPAEDPGAGALFVDLNAEDLRERMAAALAAIPHVRGVNNHMGSRFMEDDAGVAIVMEELSRRGLFFVDSRTTAGSRGRALAARAGVPFAARDIFIDHTPGYEAALAALLDPTRQDRGKKAWLLIGHPHPETLRALKTALPRWREAGIRLVPLSACVRAPSDKEKRDGDGNRRQGQISREGNP